MFLSCCIVYRCVLLFSFTRCRRHSVCQCLLLGRFFSVRFCSSTCIWGVFFILLRLCPCFCYWGFVLIFYFEVSSSYYILRLCPCILYPGFVLIVLYWGYFPQFEALVLIVVGLWVWVSIHIFYLLCLFFSLHSCNPLFWFTCSYINFNLWFCWLPCFDMCGHYSPVFIVMGHHTVLLYALLSTSDHCF